MDDYVEADAAVSAIQFALDCDETEDTMLFLQMWNEGNFEGIRRNFPEAPESVYIGAEVQTQTGS